MSLTVLHPPEQHGWARPIDERGDQRGHAQRGADRTGREDGVSAELLDGELRAGGSEPFP